MQARQQNETQITGSHAFRCSHSSTGLYCFLKDMLAKAREACHESHEDRGPLVCFQDTRPPRHLSNVISSLACIATYIIP